MKDKKNQCITEEAFMKCKCKRCEKERINMLSWATDLYVNKIIMESIEKHFPTKRRKKK